MSETSQAILCEDGGRLLVEVLSNELEGNERKLKLRLVQMLIPLRVPFQMNYTPGKEFTVSKKTLLSLDGQPFPLE